MRCSKARKFISEYIDNSLDAKQRLLLERHLEGCPDCQQLLNDFQEITEKAKGLEKLTPSPRSWNEIKAKLETEPEEIMTFRSQRRKGFKSIFHQPQFKYALVSILALAVIIGTATVGLRIWKGKGVMGRDDMRKYTLAKLEEAECHYKLAIKALEEAVLAQEGNVDPQIVSVFQKNLEIVDSSIMTCQQAVQKEPENLEVRNYLLATYMEKVDLLNEMMNIKKKSARKPGEEITL